MLAPQLGVGASPHRPPWVAVRPGPGGRRLRTLPASRTTACATLVRPVRHGNGDFIRRTHDHPAAPGPEVL